MSLALWPYPLIHGHSSDPSRGACAIAAINWLVYGWHDDAPECACPTIAPYVISGNDTMPDDDTRERFKPYLHRIAGSRSPQHEAARARIFWLAAVRIFVPRALDAAGLHVEASKLRALPDNITAAEATKAVARATWAMKVVKRAKRVKRPAWSPKAAMWATKAAEAEEWAAAAMWAAWAVVPAEAEAEAEAEAWDDYFSVLDAALNAGPQGEPWSADVVSHAAELYRIASGVEAA